MKSSTYNIFVTISIFIMLTSCNNNHKQQNQDENKSKSKPITFSEHKSQLNEYHGKNKQPVHYSLYIKKFIYPKKTIYVYKYGNRTFIDSLVISKDSVKMNTENLLLLNKQSVCFNGKLIEIKKYQYLDRSSNLFIIDSLGLILQHGQTHPYGTVIREYNSKDYHDLYNEIIEDSLFFNFEFDFKHLKEL